MSHVAITVGRPARTLPIHHCASRFAPRVASAPAVRYPWLRALTSVLPEQSAVQVTQSSLGVALPAPGSVARRNRRSVHNSVFKVPYHLLHTSFSCTVSNVLYF